MDYNCSNTYEYNMQYPMVYMYNMFPNPNFCPSKVLDPSNNETRNRFVYVNQNFVPGGITVNTKVLINPNFKPTVHINPNFRKSAKPSIHVNPNIIKINDANAVIKPLSEDYSTIKSMEKMSEKPAAIIATRTKLIRVASTQKIQNLGKEDRRKSVHTKYKIVHCNDKLADENKPSQNYLKCRYKIDKNISNIKKLIKKKNINSKYKVQNISLSKTVSTKSVKMGNSRYISINGTLYKKTPNVLRKADLVKITSGKANIQKSKILLIRGRLYKLDQRQRKLKMMSVANNSLQKLKGRYSAEGSRHLAVNKFVKLNKPKQKIKLSNIRSICNNSTLVNKMRKCNLPCPIYRRFGKCKANEMGKCIKVHNPDQIMLCTKFLQGACLNSRCLLSHKVSAEKMPTCKYFLEGLCSKEDCVYLHVKISAKADICKDFLEGYCKKAKECVKRHQFLCPDYEKNGKCPRKRCQYPHGHVVRNAKHIKKVAKRIVRKKTEKPMTIGISNTENEIVCHDKNIRYYVDDTKGLENEFKSISTNDKKELDPQFNSKQSTLSKRARLGALPSYIPFGESKLPINNVIT